MDHVSSKLDEAPVGYQSTGSGATALVFIHGLVGTHADFDNQVGFFSDRFQAVAVDLPTFGPSSEQRSDWTIEGLGQDVVSVIETLSLARVVLVGHSLGGNVALEVAHHLPAAIRGVVTVSTFRSLGKTMTPAERERWLLPLRQDFNAGMRDLNLRNFGPNADSEIIDDVLARVSTRSPASAIALLESRFQHNETAPELIKSVDAPIFAINPDLKPNDESSFRQHGVNLREIHGVGHFVMQEAPDRFNSALADILEELPH